MSTSVVSSLGWLIGDTFRQAKASGLFWGMLGVTGLVLLVCLSVAVHDPASLHDPNETVNFIPAMVNGQPVDPDKARMSGTTIIQGKLTIAFGTLELPLARDHYQAVQFLQLLLIGGIADVFGLLLALIWTAGFLPTFLTAQSVSVLLAKPTPRWVLLLGKFLGVLAFVTFQALVFVVGVWAVLGLRTGVWTPLCLGAIPILLIHFLIFFGFSALLAVTTRNTVVCVLGSLLFWMVCWGVNFARILYVGTADPNHPSLALGLIESAYWILPKPADFYLLLFTAIQAGESFVLPPELKFVQEHGFDPALSILLSLVFAALTFALAEVRFLRTDY